jgi:hypothetical protein
MREHLNPFERLLGLIIAERLHRRLLLQLGLQLWLQLQTVLRNTQHFIVFIAPRLFLRVVSPVIGASRVIPITEIIGVFTCEHLYLSLLVAGWHRQLLHMLLLLLGLIQRRLV